MTNNRKKLEKLLLQFPFFQNLQRKEFYLAKFKHLKEEEVKELIEILEKILNKHNQRVLELKEEWQKFIQEERKRILDLVKKKTKEREEKEIEKIKQELKLE